MPVDGAPQELLVDGIERDSVPALDRGLHYGDGLFETLACVGGRARFLSLHLARLALGCERLGLPAPAPEELRQEIRRLAARSERGIVKLILTRGAARARGYRTTGTEKATRITLRYRWEPDDPQLALEGVRVRTARLRLGENPALAGLKHCNRLEQVLARREWSDPAIAEALMFSSTDHLISGTMSNVFLVAGAKLRTPRLDRCGVAGIMRSVVLREAAAAGIAAEEALLEASDLARAPELFLTSALIGVRPVRSVDGECRSPGAVTRELQSRLAPLLAASADA
ncbi:MAG TPA: aminodeoxychorismate lyase [Steroidobacteraceae bacterium]|nr:aminodeoxychorismate lyase [Steroidobacteraceae bacterium]